MFLDPVLILLWACAITCIGYGAVRSHSFYSELQQDSASTGAGINIYYLFIFIIL